MSKEIYKKKITVIGAGVSGRAVAKLARSKGADVFVSDGQKISEESKAEFDKYGILFEENGNTKLALEADKIVVSSGIPPYSDIVNSARACGIEPVGELDFSYPYLNGKIIAVTGSNGKTTTTSILAELLEKNGYRVTAAGNIGLGIAELADKQFDYIAMELSSFQLYWSHNFVCAAGIITNLAPDHLNWHGSYENYIKAKAQLFGCVDSNGVAICQKRDFEDLAPESRAKIYTLDWEKDSNIYMDMQGKAAWLDSEKLFDFSDTQLLGTHNMENVAMALAALKLCGAKADRKYLAEIKAPAHRCEFAGEIDGIMFVNDSKGTNVAASITAMSSLPGKKIVILGGQGKGENYAPLAEAVKKYARCAIVLGEEKEKIAACLKEAGFTSVEFAATIKDSVIKAYKAAKSGETVLLSPACTSWDMYRHFEERGEDFCNGVKELKESIKR